MPVAVPALVMENGLGGFTPDGREYVVVLEGERDTPLPWSNVLANAEFGTIVSSAGSAFTWAGNSRENRLTPFANDPLAEPTGEAFFLRDEETGAVWGATPDPLPRRADGGRWVIRHAAGVTRYQHAVDGLTQELAVFVATEDPVKLSVLTLTQHVRPAAPDQRLRLRRMVPRAAARRRAAVRGHRAGPRHGRAPRQEHLQRRIRRGASRSSVPARHRRRTPAIAREFIGRNRNLGAPAALLRERLGGRTGAGLDPCAALQVVVELEPGESRQVAFVLGQGRDDAHARDLAGRYGTLAQAAATALAATERMWDVTVSAPCRCTRPTIPST